jgi:curved DNA-binding protein CbpA
LAKSYHPDQSGSAEIFQAIKLAYETLSDDEKRFDYDLSQGYLNAIDIDQMENNLKLYGTRYMTPDLKQILEAVPESTPKPKPSESPQFSDLFYLRLKFLLSLLLGFPLSYSVSLHLIETFIYPINPP